MDILRGSDEVTDLVVGNGACPFANVTSFDLSVYPRLETLRIDYRGFSKMVLLNITGLSDLESVEIGDLYSNSYSFWYASLELKSILIHSE